MLSVRVVPLSSTLIQTWSPSRRRPSPSQRKHLITPPPQHNGLAMFYSLGPCAVAVDSWRFFHPCSNSFRICCSMPGASVGAFGREDLPFRIMEPQNPPRVFRTGRTPGKKKSLCCVVRVAFRCWNYVRSRR